MNGKILIVSLVISALMITSVHSGLLDSGSAIGSASSASLDMNNFGGDIIQFAVGNVIVLLMLTGIIYFFVRGVCRSFGKM